MVHFNKTLAPNKGPLIVMCSGGVDSIACAHFLSRTNNKIWLYHFNHKLREQNDEMADRVEAFAEALGVGCISGVARSTLKSEAQCREARLTDLQHWISQYKEFNFGSKVICCHHLDDCVESYLMNTFNGNAQWAPIPVKSDWEDFSIYRPFLLTRKVDLIRWVKKWDLGEWVVEDETNKNFNIRRNFVRHELRPMIETRWTGLATTVKKKVIEEYNKW